jgi:hypothetical protein
VMSGLAPVVEEPAPPIQPPDGVGAEAERGASTHRPLFKIGT